MKVQLISVVAEYTNLLPYMLAHYRKLGVDEIHIHAHVLRDKADDLRRIAKVVRDFRGKIASETIGDWSLSVNHAFIAHSTRLRSSDWFLVADPDEFQIYEDDLHAVLRFCERQSYDYIEGCFIDRVAADGSIKSLKRGEEDLWRQYPLGGMLSGPIGGAVISKIVALKGGVKMTGGQHYAVGKACPIGDQYVQVHHFKWLDNVVRKLLNRSKHGFGNEGRYSEECAKFVRYLKRNRKFSIHDKELMLVECNPAYPNWDDIKKIRKSAAYFSPWLSY